MPDRETVVRDLQYLISFGGASQQSMVFQIATEALVLLNEQETVEHACDILRANGWKETEPLCSECDAVHVVRCKDCKHLGCTNSHWFCKWQNRCVDEDWFCADGERKDS